MQICTRKFMAIGTRNLPNWAVGWRPKTWWKGLVTSSFVHGGLAPDLNYLDKTLSEINNTMRPFYFIQEDVFRIDDEILRFLFDANGPIWYRNYVMGQAQDAEIEESLRKFGAKRIIVGHTLVNAVKSFYGGKVIAIDTRHVDPNSTALLYEDGKLFRIDQMGKRAELKL